MCELSVALSLLSSFSFCELQFVAALIKDSYTRELFRADTIGTAVGSVGGLCVAVGGVAVGGVTVVDIVVVDGVVGGGGVSGGETKSHG